MAETEAFFADAKARWANGERVPLFSPSDAVAWYVYQAQCYADASLRPNFFEPDGYRIAPLFRRLGQLLPALKRVGGVEERAARLVTDGRSQPDDGIYELLVAAAYEHRSWNVEFVPEQPGIQKQPDLFANKGRSSWAIECKRAGRSGYARNEKDAGQRMADAFHELSRRKNRSMVAVITFTAELAELDPNYLAEHAARFIGRRGDYSWSDEAGRGVVTDVFWRGLKHVLQSDDITFGCSRMIELVLGSYRHDVDYSTAGRWRPAPGRPFHATSVTHLSLVAWKSASVEAARRKAQHFRGIVGRASEQLPGDRPGAIHVGYEAVGGNSADALRHRLNRAQMTDFDPGNSRLNIVYGNYFMPEHVTDRNESSAVTETLAWYPVKRSRYEPLPHHMLFVDDEPVPGHHFPERRSGNR